MPTHESGGAQGTANYQSQDAAFFLSNYRLGKTLGVGSFGKVQPAYELDQDLPLPPSPTPPPSLWPGLQDFRRLTRHTPRLGLA